MQLLSLFIVSIFMISHATAQDYQVEMKNQGELGYMVFEPSFLQLKLGDTVTFKAVDLGHNAQIIRFMKPRQAKAITGAINEEITMKFDVNGFYGVKCQPHFTMGMVMLIKVGDSDSSELIIPPSLPKYVKKRFMEIAQQHSLPLP
ncbi:pseudoazurin [Marinomonas sp. THO17]|uniref:pseudoazurin n=1 Tax=Marinomonas sp. THO17 TaxID=3149048 RepID=UPI00336BDA24